jgi:hypothetical protein
MATYRLDTDVSGELIFVEEENGSFQRPAPRPPWERDRGRPGHHENKKRNCDIFLAAC